MDLFEYQARDIFAKHGVPVLGGAVIESAEEARAIAEEWGGRAVVKAQVKVGGAVLETPTRYRQASCQTNHPVCSTPEPSTYTSHGRALGRQRGRAPGRGLTSSTARQTARATSG